jgi:hypothetical protein
VYVFRIDDLAHGGEGFEGSAELRATFEPVTIPLPAALPAAAAAVPFIWIARRSARQNRPA